MRPSRQTSSILVSIALAATLTGCAPQGPEYRLESKTYTESSALRLLESPVPDRIAALPAADTPVARERALTGLRSRGGDAADAADVLTETFVSERGGVPYLVIWARYGDDPALIVLESVRHGGGQDSGRRLWVLDREGDVLLSAQK